MPELPPPPPLARSVSHSEGLERFGGSGRCSGSSRRGVAWRLNAVNAVNAVKSDARPWWVPIGRTKWHSRAHLHMLGNRLVISSSSPVNGEVLLPVLNQPSIEGRSYVLPSAEAVEAMERGSRLCHERWRWYWCWHKRVA